MQKLIAIVFLLSFLIISVALNVFLFGMTEEHKFLQHRIEGHVERMAERQEYLEQRNFLCEQLLQECMDLDEEETHLRVSGEENSTHPLTTF